MNRRAGRVENLNAAARAVVRVLDQREDVTPVRGEDAQIDLLAEHQPVSRIDADIRVRTDLLMHAGFVPRQRHHRTESRDILDDLSAIGAEAGAPFADQARDQFRFAHTQSLGGIPRPHPLFLGLQVVPRAPKVSSPQASARYRYGVLRQTAHSLLLAECSQTRRTAEPYCN